MTGKSIVGHALKFVIPLVISVGLCYLLFTGIDFNEMLTIMSQQCDYRWLAFGCLFSILAQVSRAYRWGIQLKALGITPPKSALIFSVFGTYAVNLVFPRLGEIWRCGYIAERQKSPFTTIFGSMMADRLSDTLAVLLMTLGAFIVARAAIVSFLESNGAFYATIGHMLASPWLWAAAVAAIAAVWALLKAKTQNTLIVRIQSAAKDLWQGFAGIMSMNGKGLWLLLTVGIWFGYSFQMYLAFHAFPFTRALLDDYGIQVTFVTFVISSISMGVPSNGGIGPWQWAVIFSLGIYGLGTAQAGAFANLLLGTTTLLTIFLGILTFVAIALDKRRHAEISKQINSNK